MKTFLRDNGLTLTLLLLFGVSVVGQAATGFAAENAELAGRRSWRRPGRGNHDGDEMTGRAGEDSASPVRRGVWRMTMDVFGSLVGAPRRLPAPPPVGQAEPQVGLLRRGLRLPR